MPVAVQMPNRQEKTDPLDTILKGLDIASRVYGIKDAHDRSMLLQQDRELNKAKLEQSAREKERESTTLSQKDFFMNRDKFDVVDEKTPGASKFYVEQLGRDPSEVYLLPKDKQALARKTDTTVGPKTDVVKIEKLAPEQQAIATGLSQKNAGKIAIKNQIDAVMGNWDNLTDEQKMVQGGQLLKTLNSTEGADAIGAEEVKRLGSLLQFQLFNIFNPGPVFGRDLEGFKTQAKDTSSAIGRAIDANRAIIEEVTGRKQAYQGTPSPPQQQKQTPMITKEDAARELIRRQGLRTAVGRK